MSEFAFRIAPPAPALPSTLLSIKLAVMTERNDWPDAVEKIAPPPWLTPPSALAVFSVNMVPLMVRVAGGAMAALPEKYIAPPSFLALLLMNDPPVIVLTPLLVRWIAPPEEPTAVVVLLVNMTPVSAMVPLPLIAPPLLASVLLPENTDALADRLALPVIVIAELPAPESVMLASVRLPLVPMRKISDWPRPAFMPLIVLAP